ncbi:unnamed protein product [Citrullus colocynthis]|uniref:ALA-interacting subunit n=1 Tax=Citrullus colocynthis TaxID=252529 RepID=A0ABP0YC00_9ROSI
MGDMCWWPYRNEKVEMNNTHGATSSAGRMQQGNSDSSTPPKKSKKPKYSRFTQQELPACKPILTPGWVITSFVAVGIIFIPIGIASLFASEQVVEIVDQYDHDCLPPEFQGNPLTFIKDSKTNKTCSRELTVPKPMKGPVFIYYQLDNFYQNHRRYVKSRSDKQLRSKAAEADTKTCAPEATIGQGAPIVPCGLIAWSLFNDTYGFSMKNKALHVSKKDIAWKSDQEKKYGSDVYPKNFQSGSLIGGAKLNASIPLSQQEDLIVWMRTAALPTFRKLYGKIEADFEANDIITVVIENNYNTYSFGGKKKLVLSTTSWIGGKNDFLGIAYLTVGGLCLFLAITFILLYVIKPRPLGDPSYLSWNRNAAGQAN